MPTAVTCDSIKDAVIHQHKTGYRFSIDAVLLADFVGLKICRSIADLCSGSGVIGILLAKRYPKAHVHLIELQESLHRLALENITANDLSGRVIAIKHDIRAPMKSLSGFDLAVSNPPFRSPKSGLLSAGDERAIARHELKMSLGDLARYASSILRSNGRFCMVYHPERLCEAFEKMRLNGLEPKRMRLVHGRYDLEARMALIEAVKLGRPGLKIEKSLIVYESDGKTYTDEVKNMCLP